MIIRKARVDEAGVLTALALRSKASWGYDEAFMQAIREDMVVAYEYLEREHAIVAEHDGHIAGYAIMRVDASEAYLRDLFVEPSFMRSSVGTLLFDRMLADARECGAKRLTLIADPYAVGFYERYGIREIGRESSTYVPGRTLPVLALDL